MEYRIVGWADYNDVFMPRYLQHGMTVYDVGGGKHPLIGQELKRVHGLKVVGIDIDKNELLSAPAGAYDEVICSDIMHYRGRRDGDLVLSRSVLEHMKDVERAFESILKPDGIAVVFVPSRNALFARLNLLLPERVKQSLLFAIYPETSECQGYPSYYDRCTLKDFKKLGERHGLEVLETRAYFTNKYFTFFFPIHFLWRMWVVISRMFAGDQATECFSIAFRKRPTQE